jgi:hypothetical protein
MIDTHLFKLMVEKQNELRKQYYENKKRKMLMKVIRNRKYKSKGNKDAEDINKALIEMGFIEEIEELNDLEISKLFES